MTLAVSMADLGETVPSAYLAECLRDAHARTLELVDGLDGDQLLGPKIPIVNPLVWEIGHVAWFHEYFILRRLYDQAPILANGDQVYDSIAIHHETRWDLPLLTLDDTLAYIDQVLETLIGRLDGPTANAQDSYIYRFATYHEDMHTEAYTYTRQTLGFPEPGFAIAVLPTPAGPLDGDAEVPGGTLRLGSEEGTPFVFDNEKWGHSVTVAPFHIARAAVTNAAFQAFVDAGGYGDETYWDADGWTWRGEAGADHPVYWVPDTGGAWGLRRFDDVIPLPPHRAVVHVNWYEASAYCRWAGRRLPTEVEWEMAAACEPATDGDGVAAVKRVYPWGDAAPSADHSNLDGRALGTIDVGACAAGDSAFGCRQMLGNVWEWTETTFGPFAGFSPDAYKEYSKPLFGETKVLRGGGWATRSRLASNRYRNFFGPDRRDVVAGFRTCAL